MQMLRRVVEDLTIGEDVMMKAEMHSKSRKFVQFIRSSVQQADLEDAPILSH